MKIKDLDPLLVSELRITFDEDPCCGNIDIIIPIATEKLSDILGEKLLNTDIHLMTAIDDAIIVSTATR